MSSPFSCKLSLRCKDSPFHDFLPLPLLISEMRFCGMLTSFLQNLPRSLRSSSASEAFSPPRWPPSPFSLNYTPPSQVDVLFFLLCDFPFPPLASAVQVYLAFVFFFSPPPFLRAILIESGPPAFFFLSLPFFLADLSPHPSRSRGRWILPFRPLLVPRQPKNSLSLLPPFLNLGPLFPFRGSCQRSPPKILFWTLPPSLCLRCRN